MFEDDLPRKKTAHEIGQDLDALSVEELGLRIAFLEAEITRLKAACEAKGAVRSAADMLFKR